MKNNLIRSRSSYGKIFGVSIIALFMVMTAISAVVLFATPAGAIPPSCPPGMVSYWTFDDESGSIADDSFGLNDGTLINGPAWTTGQVNGALDFDGVNDYVKIGDKSEYGSGLNHLTLEAWINVDVFAASGENNRIINKDDDKNFDNYQLLCNGNNIQFGVRLDGSWRQLTGGTDLSTNTWYHVVATYDRDEIRIYIDGQLDGTLDVPNGPPAWLDGEPLYIGGNVPDNEQYFDGKLDEVAIYNVALSDSDIKIHYCKGLLELGYCDSPSTVDVDDVWTGSIGDEVGTGEYFGVNAFATIQKGIDAVDVSGTVNVGAGTYSEGTIVIGKSLTIQGAGKADTVIDADGAQYGISIRTDPLPLGGVLDYVAIKDLTVRNALHSNIIIYHTTVDEAVMENLDLSFALSGTGYRSAGLGINAGTVTDWTVDGCTFENIYLFGVRVDSGSKVGHLTVIDSDFSTTEDARIMDGVLSQAGIESCGNIDDLTVIDSTFTGTVNGIRLFWYWRDRTDYSIDSVDIKGSTFEGNDVSFFFYIADEHANQYKITNIGDIQVNGTSFINNEWGVKFDDLEGVYGNVLIDAENNWWGHDASGPYDPSGSDECYYDYTNYEWHCGDLNADGLGDSVSDNVDYCPWIILPVTVELGEPQIYLLGTPMIGAGTPVQINADDTGCGTGAYQIQYSVTGPSPGNFVTVIDNEAGDTDDRDGYISVLLYFSEDCHHEIDYRAQDYCGNWNPSETGHLSEDFYVDATPPTTVVEVEGAEIDITGTPYSWMGSCTIKWINVTDDGCGEGGAGAEYLYLNVYLSESDEGGPWEPIESYVIPDNGFDGKYADLDPDDGEISVKFQFVEDCWHKVDHWAVDYVENEEPYGIQLHMIDVHYPVSYLEITGGQCQKDDFEICVKTNTLIGIITDNDNIGIEPCIYPEYWTFFRIQIEETGEWYPDQIDGTGDYDVYGAGAKRQFWKDKWWYVYAASFSFTEECNHILEFFAKDPLCNTEPTHVYTFYVDDQAPHIDKQVIGDQIVGVGYPAGPDYYISCNTDIVIDAGDLGCCDELTEVTYCYHYDGNWYGPWDITGQLPKTINFAESCEHLLKITAKDCLGNTAEDVEMFYVDCTPPDTFPIKVITGDQYDDGIIWVTTDTEFTFDTTSDPDLGCMGGVGLDYIKYRIMKWDGSSSSWQEELGWTTYSGMFKMPSTCHHKIEWYGVDLLGNTEDINEQEHYVDDTPPITIKIVGTPQYDGGYWVTTSTLIELDAIDYLGCAVGVKEIHYRIAYDANENNIFETGEYGLWVIVSGDHAQFYFGEECYHKLEWFAVDYLDNTEGTHVVQYHRVDSQPPITTKTFIGPTYHEDITGDGDFDDPGEEHFWLRDKDTLVILNSVDTQIPCAVGVDYLHVELWWDSDNDDTIDTMLWSEDIYDGDGDDTNPAPGEVQYKFQIDEDCLHEIVWYAVDKLGNGEPEPVEPVILFYDDFEGYTYTSGSPLYAEMNANGWTIYDTWFPDDIYLEDTFSTPGDDYVVIRDDSYIIANVDTTGYQNIKLSYDRRTKSMGWGDQFEIDWRVGNSDPWTNLETLGYYDSWQTKNWDLVGARNQPLIQIRFFLDNGNNDYGMVDDVILIGYPVMNGQQHRVDSQPPVIEKNVGNPGIEDPDDPGTWWITDYTPINLTAYDLMDPCAVGVKELKYKIEFPAGVWTDWIDYTGNFTFNEGSVHNLSVIAIDYLGNYAYDNETFIVHGGGSNDPQIEITYPEYGSTQSDRILKVVINASDVETSWPNLDVKLWIAGGRRDAPDLIYDVTEGDEPNEYVSDVPIYYYQNGTQITLWALAIDGDGNIEFAVPVTFYVESTIAWDQWMQNGWNRLTLPFGSIACDDSVESVLASINNGNFDLAFHYDGSSWSSWVYGEPNNTLSHMSTGKEYWIHIAGEGMRFYTDTQCPEVEIINPRDGEIELENAPDYIDIYAFDIETEITMVYTSIYDHSNCLYWDGDDWQSSLVWLECDHDYDEFWEYYSKGIWEVGHTYDISAYAVDAAGCSSEEDEVTLVIT